MTIADNYSRRIRAKKCCEFNCPIATIPDADVSLYTFANPGNRNSSHRIAVRRVTIPPAGTPYIILASQPLKPVEDELESLREVLYFATPVVLLLAGFGGWFLARQGLAPVTAMARSARQIGAGSLDQQLPIVNPRDELGQLATTFNDLLARLNSALKNSAASWLTLRTSCATRSL